VLLGLNGLVVGVLNAHEHFTIPALAPLVWNVIIVAGLVGLTPLFEATSSSTVTRSACWPVRTVQLLMCLPPLRALGYRSGSRSRSGTTRACARCSS
jgi:putative peptidoglycan lipid II flippase